jgi:hypothetical protein
MLKLYHLSFNPNLEGKWTPKVPDGKSDIKTLMTEPIYPRISLSPSFEQCFWGIYPNVSHFFEKENLPHMDMVVYTHVLTKRVQLTQNKEIVENRLVHDAHVTGECFITTSVIMHKHASVRVYNCVKNPEIEYRPYNDPAQKKRFLSHRVRIDVLHTY